MTLAYIGVDIVIRCRSGVVGGVLVLVLLGVGVGSLIVCDGDVAAPTSAGMVGDCRLGGGIAAIPSSSSRHFFHRGVSTAPTPTSSRHFLYTPLFPTKTNDEIFLLPPPAGRRRQAEADENDRSNTTTMNVAAVDNDTE